jgi:hypothetical protein
MNKLKDNVPVLTSDQDDDKQQLKREVKEIADYLSHKEDFQQDYATDQDIKNQDEIDAIGAYEWLEGGLDIRYIIGSDKEFISAQVLVAYGGPTIWVNFDEGMVVGDWGGDIVRQHFIDDMGVEDALREMWEQ